VLVFTNWTTCLTASNVTILKSGVVTNAPCDTNAAMGNSNRVWIVCTNLTIASNGAINVKAAGFRGGLAGQWGQGPGGGGPDGNGNGGGYGGYGGKYYLSPASQMGQPYGTASAPLDPGSGGGNSGYAGGGAVRIQASGHVLVNGVVNADGAGNPTVSYTGNGSGGSVYITCRTFAGTNGVVSADGGEAVPVVPWGYQAGGGGGGRVAVMYDPVAQSNLNAVAGRPAVLFSAKPGQLVVPPGTPGSLYFPDDQILGPVVRGGQFMNFTTWTTPSLLVTNGWTIFPTGLTLRVAGPLTISGSYGYAQLTNALSVVVGGNLTVTNSAALYVYSIPTNGTTDYGTLVSVTGDVAVAASSYLYPYSDPTNGGSPLFRMSNLVVAAGGSIDASGKGLAGGVASHGYGLGRGQYNASAGGYGGKGSGAATVGGTNFGWTYGSATAPIDPGSGGGGTAGGAGGGLVRMEITNTATISGSILADGTGATLGGSGGGIYLRASQFALAYGTIRANGGTGSSRGGGGGRIALAGWTVDQFDGTIAVNPGTTSPGETGTICRIPAPGPTYLLRVRGVPVRHTVGTPYDYGDYMLNAGTNVATYIPLTAEETNGMRYYCMGWTLTNDVGTVVDVGASTQSVFTLSTNLALSWLWTNQYWLSTTAGSNGGLVADQTGWYTNGVVVSVTATSAPGYTFLTWNGSGVPPGYWTTNPLTVTMDCTRTLHAVFADNSSSLTRTWNGQGTWTSETNW
jgi:hypothetical protein